MLFFCFVYGTHSQLQFFASHTGIHKILASQFDVLEIDEFRTSKLYNKNTSVVLEKKKVKIEKYWRHGGRRERRLNQVLTTSYGDNNNCTINRDKNSALNLLNIMNIQIRTKQRPVHFQR